MTPEQLDQLVARANAAGFSSAAHYAAQLEITNRMLCQELQALVNVFLEAPFIRAERLLHDIDHLPVSDAMAERERAA